MADVGLPLSIRKAGFTRRLTGRKVRKVLRGRRF